MGLVRVPMVVDWVGHNSFGSRGDWSVFLLQLVELVRFSSVVVGIGMNFFGN